jgi:hypothetical protein
MEFLITNGRVEVTFEENGYKVHMKSMPLAMAREFIRQGALSLFKGTRLYVDAKGDPSVGIPRVQDEVYVFAESGDFGGDTGAGITDFETHMIESLEQWYDEKGVVSLQPPAFYDPPEEPEPVPPACAALAIAMTKDDRVAGAVKKFYDSMDGDHSEILLLNELVEVEAMTSQQGAMAVVDGKKSRDCGLVYIYFFEDTEKVMQITKEGCINIYDKKD